MPDDDIAWARATVLHALGGSRFEVKVERPEDGGGLKPRITGSVVVDASGPGFDGMDTLPLQVGGPSIGGAGAGAGDCGSKRW